MSRSREFAVEVRAVTRAYRGGPSQAEVEVLRGVDLAVAPGEFVALTGPPGCGKSTLLHLIAGLDAPTGGTVRVAGVDLNRLSERERTRFRSRTVGLVWQSFNLLDSLTVGENVALPLVLDGVSARVAARRADAALARVGLRGLGKGHPTELPKGVRQQAAVARAIAAGAPLVLADEPTGSLDAQAGRTVFDLLRYLAGEHERTVLLVTRDASLARRADRTVSMRDGRLRADAAIIASDRLPRPAGPFPAETI